MSEKLNIPKLRLIKSQAMQPKKNTILMVDCDIENLNAVVEILSQDYHVLKAGDGQEALELIEHKAKKEPIHLIISEHRLPRMSGMELMARSHLLLPDSIKVILSGYTDYDGIIDSPNSGVIYEFLSKPLETSELMNTVRRALRVYETKEKASSKNNGAHSSYNSLTSAALKARL
ncbi:MAG: response regulator [SAR324 cluster bacterium]|nr:response regulator [SAR324 cluster bacterium]